MNPIYLDNSATTPMLPAVWEAMRPFLTDTFGNPASAHQFGRKARQGLEDARESIAVLLDAHPDEVIFTSGATEANNLAITGLVGQPPGHIICSPVEHPSVAEPVRRLSQAGLTVDWLPVDASGLADAAALKSLLREDTRLVTIQLANHETGTIQDGQSLRKQIDDRIPFHCDATQAVGKDLVQFHNLRVTSLSLSAHKFHGPKGIGALLLRRGTRLQPLVAGGHQQHGLRPGTEPVSLVVGLAEALQLACGEMKARLAHVTRLRQRFLDELSMLAAPVTVNGGGLPHIINLSFPGCASESLLMNLDLAGVACSTGSACSSGSLLPSPVLQAMGLPADRLHSAMRFSLSPLLTEEDVTEAVSRIALVVQRLRQQSGQ